MKKNEVLLVALLIGAQNIAIAETEEKEVQLGLGLGVRYAGVGATLEYPINEKYSVYGGVGRVEDTSYNLGVNYYFSESKKIKYRVSAGYGFVVALSCEDEEFDEFNDTFHGVSLSVGLVTKHFEFSLGYRDLSEYDDRRKELERNGVKVNSNTDVAFSIGYLF